MANQPVVIIKKVRHGKHGHHGGAWKLAYADFVTAMMAFFLVMWLVGQNSETRRSVAQYFREPGAFELGGSGVLPGSDRGTIGGGLSGAAAQTSTARAVLERTAQQLRDTLASKFSDVKDRIDVVVGEDGLLIELREAPDDGFFSSGSATVKSETVRVLTAIGLQLKNLPNKIAVEGHTDSAPFETSEGYGNWELSTDRANAARRVLEAAGVGGHQIGAVRGYADTRLRTPDAPRDAGNRRISIVVRRDDAAVAAEASPASWAGAPQASTSSASPRNENGIRQPQPPGAH